VNHYAAVDDQVVRSRGVIGQQSFGAAHGDELDVRAQLSRPAYSYVIIFRPDGQDQVLYPQDDTDIPEFTDSPVYPSKRRDERYFLEEGAGLWIIAMIVSDAPLPSYRQWKAAHVDAPWRPGHPGKSGTVWWDDGQFVRTLEPSGHDRGVRPASQERGSKKSPELESVVRLTDWLRAQGAASVQAVAFTVK
jgi:hypothetical protein